MPLRSLVMGLGIAAAIAAAGLGVVSAQERGTKVVPERPARVFVMAGFDAACQSLGPVDITVTQPPSQGAVTFREGQQTTVQYAVSGTCIGARLTGTGIYYTAKKGASGTDTFAISATLGTGAPATRTFTVRIADE